MSLPLAVIRTFVAVPISDAQRSSLVALLNEFSPWAGPAVRWVQPTLMHITLAFLGDVESATTHEVCDIAEEVASGIDAFSWTLEGLGAFPTLDRAAILWAGVQESAGGVAQLHRALEEGLRAIGYQPEDRPFRPHITIGRVARGRRLPPEVRSAFAADWKGPSTRAEFIDVMSSVLGPQGPEYTVLRRCALRA